MPGAHGRQQGMAKLPPPPLPAFPVKKPSALSKPHAKRKIVLQAQWDYTAQSRDEITFEKGAIVAYISKDEKNDGWIVVQTRHGTTGLVPGRYFRQISANDMGDNNNNKSKNGNSNNSSEEDHRLHILKELTETEQVRHAFTHKYTRATCACT